MELVYEIFIKGFRTELQKIGQFELPAFAISRTIKPILTGHPRGTEKPKILEKSIKDTLSEHGITDYKVSVGKRVPEKKKVMKALGFDIYEKIIGKNKAKQLFNKTMPYRDWTLANPKILHVGTGDPGVAAHEIGHAIHYSKHPEISKYLFRGAETAAAVPALLMTLGAIPKLRAQKIMKPFIKRPFLMSALFGVPLLARETYANIKALQIAPEGKKMETFWKKVLPLQAAYTGVVLSPAIIATILRKVLRK